MAYGEEHRGNGNDATGADSSELTQTSRLERGRFDYQVHSHQVITVPLAAGPLARRDRGRPR